MNKVILIGRLGADPELKYTQGGVAVCRIRMVTSRVWYDKQHNKQESSEWHTVVIWDKAGENVAKYVGKGDQIAIEGELQTREWEDKQGVKHYTTEIRAHHFEFGAKSQANQGQRERPQNSFQEHGSSEFGSGEDDSDEIPF